MPATAQRGQPAGCLFGRLTIFEEMTMKKLLIVHLLAIGFLAGCNTIEGVGEDVEAGGEGIQDAAESAK